MTINTNATSAPTLRILCLHDNHSNAFDLQTEFQLLGKKLYENHSIDLIYVNGPLSDSEDTEASTKVDANHKYVWWEKHNGIISDGLTSEMVDEESQFPLHRSFSVNLESQYREENVENTLTSQNTIHSMTNESHLQQPDFNKADDSICHYNGLDASLMLLRQIWTSCPFWGIIGVGKGAAIASLFMTILESETLAYHAAATINVDDDDSAMAPHLPLPPNSPHLAIFVSGESLISVDEPLLVNRTLPSILHLIDSDIPPEQELLIRQFPEGCHIERREKHHITSRGTLGPRDLNTIGRFICQNKKRLHTSDHDDGITQQGKILSLRSALFNAEQDAANCIAETIALNPPAALMAVIQPQMVAGWHGNRRPQPAGGGAPCPEEFLHRKKANAETTYKDVVE